VSFDQKVTEAEMRGETPLKYGESEFVHAVEKLCDKLMVKE